MPLARLELRGTDSPAQASSAGPPAVLAAASSGVDAWRTGASAAAGVPAHWVTDKTAPGCARTAEGR
jgi:hypothetical protein